jgi:hypothetical protein
MMKTLRRFFVLLVIAVAFGANTYYAHEVQPVVVDITLDQHQANLDLTLNVEVVLAGIDASITQDTNDSAAADQYDELRRLDANALAQLITARDNVILDMVQLSSGDQRLQLSITDITIERDVDLNLPRQSCLSLSAKLPPGDSPVTLGLATSLGAFVIRQQDEHLNPNDLYTDYIAAGQTSLPIPRGDRLERTNLSIFGQYIQSGIAHIIPKGLDHIIFIMGLFFFSPRWRPLLMQVTIFTLAHSCTLALATLGWVKVSATVVEPLIALSIVWIGVENIIRPKIGAARLAVIFTFGLLHGLGFAFVLGKVGLAGSAFAISLVGFNIGVEIGQLLVLMPCVLLSFFFRSHQRYHQRVEIPASMLIALTGFYWFIERVFLS